jgi:NAD/NADP transhydrogenase beta subunit
MPRAPDILAAMTSFIGWLAIASCVLTSIALGAVPATALEGPTGAALADVLARLVSKSFTATVMGSLVDESKSRSTTASSTGIPAFACGIRGSRGRS